MDFPEAEPGVARGLEGKQPIGGQREAEKLLEVQEKIHSFIEGVVIYER